MWHNCQELDEQAYEDFDVYFIMKSLKYNWRVWWKHHFDGLVQEWHNSIANALELHLSCTNPNCKKDVTPLLTHRSYVLLALTYRFIKEFGSPD